MWGQAKGESRSSHANRIIPTRVGTRVSATALRPNLQDHPHACGDKVLLKLCENYLLGSSPRVWGQACPQKLAEILMRIIPTRVGTRDIFIDLAHVKKDHPHACGDKNTMLADYIRSWGSSPRVWGQVICQFTYHFINGIIPTRVGTSLLPQILYKGG